MTTAENWWEVPYKGGKMVVPQKYFPRPVYPPDAAGHPASENGPDVEAYKRTVSRAGRWPWQAFDRTYSNGFAHGQGGNVIDSGVAGVQRQQNIDDTGWIGQKTFNTLASIRCPKGPHEGEMAMDANSVNLIMQAWELYQGQDPPPPDPDPPFKTTRLWALEGAKNYIGTKESPANSNLTKFGAWYGMDGQPWCAMFVTYCFEVEAGGSDSFVKGSRYAYCPYVLSDARSNRYGLSVTSSPIPGDVVLFDWDFDNTFDHIGIFEAWVPGSSQTFTAIEGNTSTSDNSNGGQVMRRERTINQQGTVFVRVAE